MQVINIRGPGDNPWTNSASNGAHAPATSTQRQPIEDLLIKVGKIVLGDELHSEYIVIGKIARVAQKYKIKWPGHTHRTETLKELVMQYSDHQQCILGDGIKVTWRLHRADWESEVELRFHRYDPANDGPMPNCSQ